MIHFAGIPGVIRTILIIVIVYYVLRLITRFILPMLVKSYFGRGSGHNQNQSQPNPSPRKSKTDDLGEYVDFEEIDDQKDEKH